MQKYSFGIILCRLNKLKQVEFLLVRKRCTYEFVDFVMGKYSTHKYQKFGYKIVDDIVKHMTPEELKLVKNGDFNTMWDHIFPIHKHAVPSKYAYMFNSEFNGRELELRRLTDEVTVRNQTLWEVPKGAKHTMHESNIICAMRELEEETGIRKNNYQIIPDASRKLQIRDNGIEYNYIFYIALTTNFESALPVNYETNEICDYRWFTIENIKYSNEPMLSGLLDVLQTIPTIVKKFIKGDRKIFLLDVDG